MDEHDTTVSDLRRILGDTIAELGRLKSQLAELAAALTAMTDEYAKSMKDAGVTQYPESLFKVRLARAALAKLEKEGE